MNSAELFEKRRATLEPLFRVKANLDTLARHLGAGSSEAVVLLAARQAWSTMFKEVDAAREKEAGHE